MENSAMDGISERLSSVQGLYFPRSFLQSEASEGGDDRPHRKAALLDLLSRDAPVFLERYGSELTAEELISFDVMKEDYEVGWHLNRLRRSRDPSVMEEKARSTRVKNRRRAYLEDLMKGGNYFSEDAMREREPYLHHEYVGRFQDISGRGMPRPGERWSDTLMRRAEEVILIKKIRGEQQRRGVSKNEWVGGGEEEEQQEEEEEEEEEEQEEEHKEVEGKEKPSSSKVDRIKESNTGHPAVSEPSQERLSASEIQDQLDQFTRIMQEKFLAGEDSLDYSTIDNDERLDDHWLKEANLDAEERYFDED